MVESVRGFVRVVERGRIVQSTVFVLNVEECLEDGLSFLPQLGRLFFADGLELADLVVDKDV